MRRKPATTAVPSVLFRVPLGLSSRVGILVGLGVLTCLALVLGIGMGAVWVSPSEVVAALLQPFRQALQPVTQALGLAWPALGTPAGSMPDLHHKIITQLRLPRVLLSGISGASLGVAGALFQALFRNPLADPYIIGASSGASLGAIVAMALSLELRFWGLGAVPVLAFLGATGTVLLVYQLARSSGGAWGPGVAGGTPVLTLVLAGIAVSSFLSAIVSLLTYLLADERLHQIVFWLMGGFGGATWAHVHLAFPYAAGGLAVSMACGRHLNALLLGEETAHHLGVEVERIRRLVLATAALLTGAAVASGGVIGFVGLVVPHVVRLLGGPDHYFVIPASALGGAALLMLADAAARSVLAPAELPVGLVTALAGAPFFIYVLRHRRQLRLFGAEGR